MGIFNVAIIIPKIGGGNCVCAYHLPFPLNSTTQVVLRNPENIDNAFPDKLRDVHGHELNLRGFEKKPMDVLYINGSNYGTSVRLFDLFTKKMNATYKISQTSTQSLLHDLFINRYPFSNLLNTDMDYVPAKDQNQFRILVRRRLAQYTPKYVGKYYLTKYGCILIIVFLLYLLLYSFLISRDRGCFFQIMPILIRQPALVVMKTFKERIFLAAGLYFVLMTMLPFECHLTSSLVAFVPEDKFHSLSDLENSEYVIYADAFDTGILFTGQYNLSHTFLKRLQITKKHRGITGTCLKTMPTLLIWIITDCFSIPF